MTEFYKAPKRSWWIPALVLAGLALGAVAMFVSNPYSRTFNGFEMHGGPLFINRATTFIDLRQRIKACLQLCLVIPDLCFQR